MERRGNEKAGEISLEEKSASRERTENGRMGKENVGGGGGGSGAGERKERGGLGMNARRRRKWWKGRSMEMSAVEIEKC